MLETPHVIVGAAIASKVVHPALAIPLAFGSHFVLEKIPHWNPHLNAETIKFGHPTRKTTAIVTVDATTALFLGTWIAYRALPNWPLFLTILASSLAAVVPDLLEAPYFFLGIKNEFVKKWIVFQKSLQVNATIIPGLLTQILVIAAGLWWILA